MMNKKNKKFLIFENHYSILVHGLLYLSFILFFIYLLINYYFFNGELPESYSFLVFIISSSIQIVNGIIMIYRREVPRSGGFPPITGFAAVVIGILYSSIFVLIASGLTIFLITNGF